MPAEPAESKTRRLDEAMAKAAERAVIGSRNTGSVTERLLASIALELAEHNRHQAEIVRLLGVIANQGKAGAGQAPR